MTMALSLSHDNLARLPCCAAVAAHKGAASPYARDAAVRHYRERALAELLTDLAWPPDADRVEIAAGIGTLVLTHAGNAFADALPAWPAAVPTWPSLAEQIATAAGAVGRAVGAIVRGEPVLADPATRAAREAICAACPAWVAAEKRCGRCGCYAAAKVTLATERCPDGRW